MGTGILNKAEKNCAFKSKLTCVLIKTFLRSGTDFSAFILRLSRVDALIFVRSSPDFCAFLDFLQLT